MATEETVIDTKWGLGKEAAVYAPIYNACLGKINGKMQLSFSFGRRAEQKMATKCKMCFRRRFYGSRAIRLCSTICGFGTRQWHSGGLGLHCVLFD